MSTLNHVHKVCSCELFVVNSKMGKTLMVVETNMVVKFHDLIIHVSK
jgi:hypothetical protein